MSGLSNCSEHYITYASICQAPVQPKSQSQLGLGMTIKSYGLRMTPLTHPAKKIDQVDSKIKDMRQSYMFRKKFIDEP